MKTVWMLSVLLVHTALGDYVMPGVVLPNDPYVFIGYELKLTCNLTTAIAETSTSLYFTKANIVIPKNYVQILSSRSIQLILPVISPEDEGSYNCKLNKSDGHVQVIGSQFVRVEYEPKAVDSIDCKVFNWERMTCEWELGVNYVHMDHIDVQLVWTVRGSRQYDCPHKTINSCRWNSNDGLDSFRADMLYYMVVIVTNNKTGNSSKSKVFQEETKKLVKPHSVSDLKTWNNSTCLRLEWRHNSMREKIYRIQYQSKWEQDWEVMNMDDVEETTICHLVPNTEYTIKIACKPVWDGFWSDEVETTITLDEDVPGAAPELQPGGYVEQPCGFQNCRGIIVYWRPIMDRLTNGEITNYRITVQDANDLDPQPKTDTTGTRTSGKLMLSYDKDYIVDVQGETRKGLSPHRASILIMAKDKKPPFPNNFIVEAEEAGISYNDLFRLHVKWSQPETKQRVLGYTLFWCKGSSSDFICQEPLKWAVLKGNQRTYTTSVKKMELSSLIFGISMETVHSSGETVSSGILWNECIYRKNQVPLLAPRNVRVLTLVSENSVQVEWDKFRCSELTGFITHYTVFYCSSPAGQNCSGPYHAIDVAGHETSVVLKKMSPKSTYRVWVQAVSDAGSSPESDPVFTTIPVTGMHLTTEEIAGIVIGILFIVILALLGFIFLFRRCAVEVKEQFKPYDIDMPNVPLPPIPMIRPSSKTSSHSPDDDDDIYSKIPDIPPSPTTPDSMSIDMPLINSESQNKSLYGDKRKLYVKLPENGRGSVVSAASLFSRFQLGRNSTDRETNYHDNKQLSTFRPRPKPGSKGFSGSADMLSSDVSPYSCVDIVQCPNSEKIPRKHIPSNKPCHSVGSMVDDPAYETNNLSILSNKVVTKPPSTLALGDSREHFNIKLPLDRRKSEVNTDTLNSCVSSEINSNGDETQDSNESGESKVSSYCHGAHLNEIDENKISSYCQEAHVEGIDLTDGNKISSYCQGTHVGDNTDNYIEEHCLKCSNNNDLKMRNGYILTENIVEFLPKPSNVPDQDREVYRKELNIRPGPRPVSEVINVPAHFYGSLSLLDTGTATEL